MSRRPVPVDAAPPAGGTDDAQGAGSGWAAAPEPDGWDGLPDSPSVCTGAAGVVVGGMVVVGNRVSSKVSTSDRVVGVVGGAPGAGAWARTGKAVVAATDVAATTEATTMRARANIPFVSFLGRAAIFLPGPGTNRAAPGMVGCVIVTPRRTWVIALASVAGVVVAHCIDFVVLFPDAEVRARRLQATSHSYWPLAVLAALGAAAACLAFATLRGAHAPPSVSPVLGISGGGLDAKRLLRWQAIVFLAVEGAERAASGVPLGSLASSAEIWLGLALQIPVALVTVRLLALVSAAAHRLVLRSGRPLAMPRLAVGLLSGYAFRPGRRLVATAHCRAPPSLLPI